ncbi:MAG: hypothetical protein H7A35_06370 [Planctomycetales bacterium]|nr:hypothetical protein [bacterium]UNM09684.1 MAG: hypothetical protein H7A35_06370 [Planctomycetales bacterium]
MVENKRGGHAAGARGRHTVLRRLSGLAWTGLVLVLLALAWQWWAFNLSGRLSLSQQISADEFQRGFSFGPVYIQEGVVGRYYISATLPDTPEGMWISRFEVRDASGLPVFGQDEVRLYGEHSFRPGMQDRIRKQFSLDRETGYYYFHFKSENGVFNANQSAPPVVEFNVRQGVVHGMALWLPFGCLLLLGLVLSGVSLWLRMQFAGLEEDGSPSGDGERQPKVVVPRQPAGPQPAGSSGVSALGRRHDRLSEGRGKLR